VSGHAFKHDGERAWGVALCSRWWERSVVSLPLGPPVVD